MNRLALTLALWIPWPVLAGGCGGPPPRASGQRGPRAPTTWTVRHIGKTLEGWMPAGAGTWELDIASFENGMIDSPESRVWIEAGYDTVWVFRPEASPREESGDAQLLWTDHRLADGRLRLHAKCVDPARPSPWGLVFRASGTGRSLMVRVNPEDRNLRILKFAAGEARILAGQAIPYRDSKGREEPWHRLLVEFRGEEITATLDDNLSLSAADDSLGEAGLVGLYAGGSRQVVFAGLGIIELPGPAVEP